MRGYSVTGVWFSGRGEAFFGEGSHGDLLEESGFLEGGFFEASFWRQYSFLRGLLEESKESPPRRDHDVLEFFIAMKEIWISV